MKYEQIAMLEGVKFKSGKMVLVDPRSADDPDLRYTFDVAPMEWVMRVYKREKGLIDRPAIFVMAPAGVEVDPKSDKWEAAPGDACAGHGSVDSGTVAAVDGAQAEKLLTEETKTLAAMSGKLPYGYFSATANGDGTFGVQVIYGEDGSIAAVKVILP